MLQTVDGGRDGPVSACERVVYDGDARFAPGQLVLPGVIDEAEASNRARGRGR